MKAPERCLDLDEIRVGIDTLDKEIIEALGKRMAYVLSAAQFKPTEQSIAAPERVKLMLSARRQWAQEVQLDVEFITRLFDHIIPWYIAQQTAHWKRVREAQ